MLTTSQIRRLNESLVQFLKYIMSRKGSYKEKVMFDVDILFENTYDPNSVPPLQKPPSFEDVDKFISSCFIRDNGSYQLHVVRTDEGHVGILVEESDYALAKEYF